MSFFKADITADTSLSQVDSFFSELFVVLLANCMGEAWLLLSSGLLRDQEIHKYFQSDRKRFKIRKM